MFSLLSLNVNGLQAAIRHGLDSFLGKSSFNCICLQEIKLQEGVTVPLLSEYHSYWSYSTNRKGYAGTAVFSKERPMSVMYGIGVVEFDCEGRSITLEYERFFLVNVYVPTSRELLSRLEYRLRWDKALADYLRALESKKPVIVCGDFNLALTEADVFSPVLARNCAGFSAEEKRSFGRYIDLGFIDAWRYLHPLEQRFTWWSYSDFSRERNRGWRIDYILVSSLLKDKLIGCDIFDRVNVSDHCPVVCALKI